MMMAVAQAQDIAELETLASQGDVVSSYQLGQRYFSGEGVSKDVKTALKWLEQSADAGHTEAAEKLGRLYLGGRGVPRDSKQAATWYRLAAERGSATAQTQIARMYLGGVGVLKDPVQAQFWATMAAEKKDPGAAGVLGALRSQLSAAQLAEAAALVEVYKSTRMETMMEPGVPQLAPPLDVDGLVPPNVEP